MARTSERDAEVAAADRALYDCECALHAAHMSHVDAWIEAASDHLHAAVAADLAARAAE